MTLSRLLSTHPAARAVAAMSIAIFVNLFIYKCLCFLDVQIFAKLLILCDICLISRLRNAHRFIDNQDLKFYEQLKYQVVIRPLHYRHLRAHFSSNRRRPVHQIGSRHRSYIMSSVCGFSGRTFPDRLIYNRYCGTVHDAHASDFHCLANLVAPQPLQA